jgi:SHS2 domain-containing protein
MGSSTPHFCLLDHTADLGMVVRSKDLEALFEDAAQSMIEIMLRGTSPAKTRTLQLAVTGEDLIDLMVRWLGEVLYLFQGENQVVTDTSVDIVSPSRLKANLTTVPFDDRWHEVLSEIKAVTYHQAQVAQRDKQWETTIIFDL